MSVDFGLALIEAHPKTHLSKWMDDLDIILPQFQGHFKSLWMTDHLFWEDNFSYEVWTVLSFLAARWPDFDIGPMVMGQNYRNPGLLAKMAATLQVFSKGRLILGVGSGWKVDEYRAYNYPLPPHPVRLEQLIDIIEILRRLWTQQGEVTYEGKHYAVHNAILEPKPDPVPPIVIGVSGDNALRVAAQYADWWNLSDANLPRFTDRVNVLKHHCESVGRDLAEIRKTWFGRVVVGRTESAVNELANSRNKPYTSENAFLGTPAQIVEQMLPFVELGVDYFMIDIVGLPDPEISSMIIEEILPKVQK